MKPNLWEFHEACKYVHQILLIVNKDKVGNQRRYVEWYGRPYFAGKLFDFAQLIPLWRLFKGFPVIKYNYVPSLKVAMLCVFALCRLIVFMVHWKIACPEHCQTSKMEPFTKSSY